MLAVTLGLVTCSTGVMGSSLRNWTTQTAWIVCSPISLFFFFILTLTNPTSSQDTDPDCRGKVPNSPCTTLLTMNEQAYTSLREATVVTASTKKGAPAVIKVWSIRQSNERSSVVADTTVSSSNSSFDDSWLVRFLVGGGVVTFYVVILVIMFMMLMNQHSTEGTKQDGWFLSIRNAKNLFRVRCSFI